MMQAAGTALLPGWEGSHATTIRRSMCRLSVAPWISSSERARSSRKPPPAAKGPLRSPSGRPGAGAPGPWRPDGRTLISMPPASRPRASNPAILRRPDDRFAQQSAPAPDGCAPIAFDLAARSRPPQAEPPAWALRGSRGPGLLHERRGQDPLAPDRAPVGHQRRHRGCNRERVLRGLEQPPAALADVGRIFLIAGVAERAMQFAQHHFGEADHGIERRAQLVAHLGQKLRACAAAAIRPCAAGAGPLAGAQRKERRRGTGGDQEHEVQRRQPAARLRPLRVPSCHAMATISARAKRCSAAAPRASHGQSILRPTLPAAKTMRRALNSPLRPPTVADGLPPWGDVPGVIPAPRPICQKLLPNYGPAAHTPPNHSIHFE